MKFNAARESLTAGIFLNGFPHRVRPENLIYLILRRRGLGGYQGLTGTLFLKILPLTFSNWVNPKNQQTFQKN
jgi:hypothetical protein